MATTNPQPKQEPVKPSRGVVIGNRIKGLIMRSLMDHKFDDTERKDLSDALTAAASIVNSFK